MTEQICILFGLRKKEINGSFDSLHLGTVMQVCYILDTVLDTRSPEVTESGHPCLGLGGWPMRGLWWSLRCWGWAGRSPWQAASGGLVGEAPGCWRPAGRGGGIGWRCCSQRCGTWANLTRGVFTQTRAQARVCLKGFTCSPDGSGELLMGPEKWTLKVKFHVKVSVESQWGWGESGGVRGQAGLWTGVLGSSSVLRS